MMTEETEKWMSRSEVAELLGVTVQTVWRMNRDGQLPFTRVGRGRGRVRISSEEVRKLLDSNKEG